MGEHTMSTPALGGLPPATEMRQFSPPASSPLPAQSGTTPAVRDVAKLADTDRQTDEERTATDVHQALDEIRQAIEPVARNLLFSVEEDTGKTIIKVVDASTEEVIRQIPSEEFIAISKALDKLQGLLLRQEA
jgi:flagellar protein FlaG